MEPLGIRFSDDSLPAGYDRIFTPRLFEPWARVLLDLVGIRTGDAVLDVATGPGTVARLAAARTVGAGRVAGTDISAPMLALARQKAPQPGAAPLEFQQAPADALPFAAATFDVVLCQQGLQFFPDPVAALREMHRVLKPGGRLGLAVWAQGYARDIDRVLSDCLEQAGGHRPPFPTFGTHPDDLPAALAQAGFGSIRCAEHTLELPFPSGLASVLDSLGASPMRHEFMALTPPAAERFRACAERQLQAFTQGDALRTQSVARLATAIAS